MFSISMPVGSKDYDLFVGIWNQGIDSRLEAFVKSEYRFRGEAIGNRLMLNFHPDEIQLLLRRLSEVRTEQAYYWENDIVYFVYGMEVS